MKPFIRFARETQRLYGDDRRRTRWFFWDFDAMVQKVLLGVVRGTSTPEVLAEACTRRWAVNLAQLEAGSRRKLQDVAATGRQVQLPSHPRMKYITDRMRPNARFLYVGCGVGTECLVLARQGLDVVGIDTVPGLVDVANAWARQLALPFKAVCADVMTLGPELGLFDGFLLEFYGDQPSWSQTLRLQANLHGILTNEGRGILSAHRRKYSSHWFRMGTDYSPLMTTRLAVQAHFDYRFSHADKSEEQLRYGLYSKTHTTESLAAELGRSFNILECIYESDPRYVVCVVGRKQEPPTEAERGGSHNAAESRAPGLGISAASIDELLGKVETICEMLEAHEKRVREFYDHSGDSEATSPVKGVEVDYPGFISLLEKVSAVLLDSEQ